MKKIINEATIRRIVEETVRNLLKEYGEGNVSQYQLGRLAARKKSRNPGTRGNAEADEIEKFAQSKQGDNPLRTHAFKCGFSDDKRKDFKIFKHQDEREKEFKKRFNV